MSIIAMHLPGAAILMAVAFWMSRIREQSRTNQWMRDQLTKIREESRRVERMLDEAEETLKSAREAGEL